MVITAVDDDADEPSETLQVASDGDRRRRGAGARGADADHRGGRGDAGLTLHLDPPSIEEDGGTSTVTARLAHHSGEQTTLKVTATAFDPASGNYFLLSASPMLTIAAGANDSTGVVTITAADDLTEGPRKLVQVAAEMVSGGNGVAAPDARFLTINDNDGLPTLTLALAPPSISENGGATTVTASLSGVTDQATTALIAVTPVEPAQLADISLRL